MTQYSIIPTPTYAAQHPQYSIVPPPTYTAQHPLISRSPQSMENRYIDSKIEDHQSYGPTYQGPSFVPVSTSYPNLPPIGPPICYEQKSCYVCPHDKGHDVNCHKMHDDASFCSCVIV